MPRPAELAQIDPRYGPLYDAIIGTALRAGVREVTLGGSLARGDADRYSDLDLGFVPDDDATIDAAAIVRDAMPTVLLRTLPFGVVAITPDWLRVDVVLLTGDESTARRPSDPSDLVEEFLRVLGLLPVVIGRGEWIVASDGAWVLRTLLVQLMLVERGETATTGVKRLNDKLTVEQRTLVEALPPIIATREAAIAAHLAVAKLFLPRARRLVQAWPSDLERATRSYLLRELGLELRPT
jgi:predicted nucleotidyltransferase